MNEDHELIVSVILINLMALAAVGALVLIVALGRTSGGWFLAAMILAAGLTLGVTLRLLAPVVRCAFYRRRRG